MDKLTAQQSIKRIQSEASRLETSALITLFELDISLALENQGILTNDVEKFFYFHNNVKLISTSILSQGKQYQLCPIETSDFEINSQGTLPTPKLRITVSEQGIPMLSMLNEKIRLLGDLVGCKITRRRTFAKFLPNNNFNNDNRPNIQEIDELAELPPDIWFINRKSNENKLIIEYELNSILDLENLQLPRRQMIAKRCNFHYRGEGCVYEYDARRNDNVHGEFSILPDAAPPVATSDDKLITDILGVQLKNNLGNFYKLPSNKVFQIGDFVYIESDMFVDTENDNELTSKGPKYYFVAKRAGILSSPPNPNDWIADQCSKCLKGCKLRWSATNPIGSVMVGSSGLIKGQLPFGGFLALDRMNR